MKLLRRGRLGRPLSIFIRLRYTEADAVDYGPRGKR